VCESNFVELPGKKCNDLRNRSTWDKMN